MSAQIFSIGHSTHPIDLFVALLAQHRIEVLVDIRRFPGSRKFPQFNQDTLVSNLRQADIEYRWLESLGGRRPKPANGSSMNLGLRNESFRNYADYMLTDEFRAGMDQLLAIAAARPTAVMCSESVFWRCHRRLVSDFLLAGGITVQHIMPSGELRPHTLTKDARVEAGQVTYPPSRADQAEFLFD